MSKKENKGNHKETTEDTEKSLCIKRFIKSFRVHRVFLCDLCGLVISAFSVVNC